MPRVGAFVTFDTESGTQYVYDDQTGMVFPSSPTQLALLALHVQEPLEAAVTALTPQYPLGDLREASRFIEHWETRFGAFYRDTDVREEVRVPDEEELREVLEENGFRQLILTLTEDCNLRCNYCCYSPAYRLTRNRSKKAMTFDVGRRSVDAFLEWSHRHVSRNPWRKIAIGFYGGEPLVAQDILRSVTDYVLGRAPAPVAFNVTTNGTLLCGEIADFLVAHNFSIMVSLDGDAIHHDRHRRFADGRGSHAEVVQNLLAFRERYPLYSNIRLISVLDWRAELPTLDEFFSRSEGTLPPLGRVSFVSRNGTNFFDGCAADDRCRMEDALREQAGIFMKERMERRTPSPFRRALFDEALYSTLDRRRHGSPRLSFLPYTAPCVPGTKLHVSADGAFLVCERVNGTYPIGHIDSGLDYARIRALIADYNDRVCGRCETCPVSKLCTLCYAACEADHSFQQSDDDCERVRRRAVDSLRKLYSVLEVDRRAFRPEMTDEDAVRRVALM